MRELSKMIIEEDFQLMWSIHKCSPYFTRLLSCFIHKNPMRDISIITWIFFIVGFFQYGYLFLWTSMLNLGVCWTFCQVIKAPRPFLYDSRMKPLADTYPSSYGFPGLETHMATVIFGWLAMRWSNPIGWLFAFFVITMIALSRIIAFSRFIHQVLLSICTGICGIGISFIIEQYVEKLPHEHHRVATGIIIFFMMGLFGLWIEANDSYFLKVKNEEFERVLLKIIHSSKGKKA